MNALVHPYPQAVAGVPTKLSWDPTSKVMSTTYTPKPSTGLTDVFVPARTYAHGYEAAVTGGRVTSKAQARHLLIAATGTGPVTVVVRPASSGAAPSVTGLRPSTATDSSGRGLASTGLATTVPVAAALLLLAALWWRRAQSPSK